jgi:putative oxidoreductase
MSAIDSMGSAWAPRLLSVLRIVTAFLYMLHGTQKMFSWPVPARGPYELMTLAGVSGVLEVFGGALLLLGLFSRPVAFLLSGHMAFAYFIGHASRAFWPQANGGELAIMFCFTFLYIAGRGTRSVEHRRGAQARIAPDAGARETGKDRTP